MNPKAISTACRYRKARCGSGWLRGFVSPIGSLVLAALLLTVPAHAEISEGEPLDVHILYDNSGSMYPGYEPGSGRTRSMLGARFIREYPEFRRWLRDFIDRQTVLGARTVAMSAFTSGDRSRPGDVRAVHPRVPLDAFDVDVALDGIEGWGRQTFLAEALDELTRDFEGLVWLITDNIVETGRGQADEQVRRFFETLAETPRYRSVHIFKLPFRDEERELHSDLAIYGILVSRQAPSENVLPRLDRKFREQLRTARRRPGGESRELFPGHEHLKLKDLEIDPFDLRFHPHLDVEILESKKGIFQERQTVVLKLEGRIQSNLTQHTVTAGRYRLDVSSFEPDRQSRASMNIQSIPASLFPAAGGRLIRPIPPSGFLPLEVDLTSSEPVPLRSEGFGSWLKGAFLGVRAEFTGTARMSFEGVQARFERDRMAGIYGIEQTTDVFDFEETRSINATPTTASIRFVLHGSSRRTLVVLPLLLLVGAFLAALFWLFVQKERYRVKVGSSESIVALRRFAAFPVQHEHHRLGRLRRGVSGYLFRPERDSPGVEVEATSSPGSFRARIEGQGVLGILIEPLRRKAATRRSRRPQPASGGEKELRRPGSMEAGAQGPTMARPEGASSAPEQREKASGRTTSTPSKSNRARPSLRRPK